MKIIDFKIVSAGMAPDLVEKVKQEILKDWQPLGSTVHEATRMHQTMVRYENADDYIEKAIAEINKNTSLGTIDIKAAQKTWTLDEMEQGKDMVPDEEPKPKKKGFIKRMLKGDGK